MFRVSAHMLHACQTENEQNWSNILSDLCTLYAESFA